MGLQDREARAQRTPIPGTDISALGLRRIVRLGSSHGLSAAESCGDYGLRETDFQGTLMGLITGFSFCFEVSSFKECV